ncbi:hypothetical protein [Ectobacillus ponti]|uniref:Uncharacterized protein n=1 Tax=Ectobacillus ponti TaxID=2961894 RepID=A0AA41X2Y6_9BACI|nr:hypothetical protein [Ectobacillus ponti]MCP8967652.1 hypothetical protein [Ectobacillus ponti]
MGGCSEQDGDFIKWTNSKEPQFQRLQKAGIPYIHRGTDILIPDNYREEAAACCS